MLELKNIKKIYTSGETKVEALKGINIKFRKSEFVSILGQSGCGKTTLLNIIGGLDRYTSGDLVINGVSTKTFKDRDWDMYRNYSVGFIFQSYNLINHQTILANVELALTIAGISKKERKERAIKALEEVGLKDHLYKKPNQLSGGQMQRVAIARALVNDPDIILADEPTGALDTKTSIQVMDILKKISQNKLIIMVTHNKELAEKYSSRIISILDGEITNDTMPYNEEVNYEKSKQYKRTSMKFFTALKLSLNNLLTKKGRTILTAFAGSIGIIGIALILAISTGVKEYINKIEQNTLSEYPLEIEDQMLDISSMANSLLGRQQEKTQIENGKIKSKDIMDSMLDLMSNKVQNNNLAELKKYIEKDSKIKENSSNIEYSYDLDLNIYRDSEEITQVNPSTVMNAVGMGDFLKAREESEMFATMGSAMSMGEPQNNVWAKINLDNQYQLLDGRLPEKYNEVVLIVGKNNEISDYTLYALGYKSQKELEEKFKKVQKGEKTEKEKQQIYSYNDFLNKTYKILLNSDYYKKENGIWMDKSEDTDYLKEKIKNAEEIKVVGILKETAESMSTDFPGKIGYTKELEEHIVNKSNESEIVKEQKEKSNINVFSGLEFPTESEEINIKELSQEQKMMLSKLNTEELASVMKAYTDNKNSSYEKNLKKLGAIDLSKPSKISIYPKDFKAKSEIINAIDEYNKIQVDENKKENRVTYTDFVGIMINSVSDIINTISYVLVAFVAISLIVSSIMIGIITYISVLERTKEIGILRAIGASKRDISNVFNAETLIIGLISGLLGILVTMLLTLPINSLILKITGVEVITRLPNAAAAVLVIISVLLTVIAGLIPSRYASKKDPVVALKAE